MRDAVQILKGRKLAREVMELISKDPHPFGWGVLECATCKKITKLLDADYGCVRYKKERIAHRANN